MSPSELFIYLIVATVLWYATKKLLRTLRNFREFHRMPGPPPSKHLVLHPLGNFVLQMAALNAGQYMSARKHQIFKLSRVWSRTYYPIYKTWIFYYLIGVNLTSPADCEAILPNSAHNTKSMVYVLLHNWLGTGLLTSASSKWQHRRKILTPTFHFSILQQFLVTFREDTVECVATILRQLAATQDACVTLNVTDLMQRFTLQSISKTAMGVAVDSMEAADCEMYHSAIHQMSDIVTYRLIHTWLLYPLLYFFTWRYWRERRLVRQLHKFTTKVIEERQKVLFNNVNTPDDKQRVGDGHRRRLAMLDLLLNAQREGIIDTDGIREEVDTFMFEGHDTTSSALSFALMLIANHASVQQRLYEECVDVVADPMQPTMQELGELRYMDQVIKEVLRLYPSVPFISRKIGEDVTLPSGYRLRKDTLCHIQIYDVHRSPDVYEDPERFDPERFHVDRTNERHTFAYLPFSAGPRNCIGQRFAMLEMKTLLCGVLHRFRLEPVDTPDTIVLMAYLVLRTKDHIKVKFSLRSD